MREELAAVGSRRRRAPCKSHAAAACLPFSSIFCLSRHAMFYHVLSLFTPFCLFSCAKMHTLRATKTDRMLLKRE